MSRLITRSAWSVIRRVVGCAVLATVGAAAPADAGAVYTTFNAAAPGSTGTSVTGCNAKDNVAGYYLDSSEISHGFLRTR